DVVTGSYWYDTELAPAPSVEVAGRVYYSTSSELSPEWSGITALIDGKVFDVTQDQPTGWRNFTMYRSADVANDVDVGFGATDYLIFPTRWVGLARMKNRFIPIFY